MQTVTVTVATATDDASVSKQTIAVYPPTSAATVDTTGYVYAWRDLQVSAAYTITNGILRFDTSVIPDNAIVVSATFVGKPQVLSNVDSKSLTGDWFTFTGTTVDYSETPLTTAFSGVALSSLTVGQNVSIALSNPDAYVNKTGYTGLRLHLDGGQPTGRNYVGFEPADTSTADTARLILVYKFYDAHVGNDIAVDETTTNPSRVLNAAPASTDYGMALRRQPENTGVVPCSFTTASGGIGGSLAEALATLTPVRDFTTGTAATTFTVPAGKTMRVTGFWGVARRDTATGSITWELEMNLHVDTGATATTSSPVVFSGVAAWKELVAGPTWVGTAPVWFEIPGGIDIPAGASFALGYRNSSSQPTRATNAISITGFEY